MPRPINLEDFRTLKLVSDPQIAPNGNANRNEDGNRVACVVKRIDSEKNRYVSEIWVVSYPTTALREGAIDAENQQPVGEARRFTSPDSSASHPRWSPNGRTLAFLSDRKKPLSQIYLLPADGGEARPLTQLTEEGSIGTFSWSPNGRWIAFTFKQRPKAYQDATIEERKQKGLSSPVRHHTRLFYRLDAVGYFDDAYPQVWVADATTGEAHPLTSGPHACDSLAWSPDSSTLAFLSDRREDSDIAPAHPTIYTLSVADFAPLFAPANEVPHGTIRLEEISTPPGNKDGLIWSPDGTRFVYTGNPDPLDTWGTNNYRIFMLPIAGGDAAEDLTGHTDWSVGYDTLADSHELGGGDIIQWSADGNALYFPASVRGDTFLCRIDIATREVTVLTAKGEVGSYSVQHTAEIGGERIVVVRSTATMPPTLFACVPTANGYAQATLADFNADWCAEIQLSTPETFQIDNGDGGTLHGWLLKPTDFVETEKYPLVVYVHGGPHTQYGDALMHEFQLLAARGYVVLYTNPRGSKGYGEAHTKAIFGNWGSVDFKDVMTATDYAVDLPYIASERTAIMGGSYGGFMTAWAVGHTDRYRCAIADRLVANLQSMSGTCDFPWRPDTYYKGNGWSDPAQLWHCSPLAYAGNITTPLLLIHSDGDLRCPAGQAEELFAALRLQRKTVEYFRYPAEASHGLSRNGPPDLRQDRLERNLAWLDRWLKG